MCFQADNNMFCMLVLPSLEDPLRLKLRDPEIFDRFINHIPALEGWIPRADAVTDTAILTRINNCDRRLVDADGPIVTGFVLLGDAANHTNPTTGRGISLAYAHAQRFAETVERASRDKVQFACDFDAWTGENLSVWFQSQVQLDGDIMAGMRAAFRGEASPPPSEVTRLSDALETLSHADPVAGAAFWRLHNVLASPMQVFSDAHVTTRIGALFDRMDRQAPPVLGPTRREFEVLTAG
jgi:flavin-dependent dehydrogenase